MSEETTTTLDTLVDSLAEAEARALADLVINLDQKEKFMVDPALIDKRIAELDKKLGEQLDLILHNEDFQNLEAAWRGLEYVVKRTSFEEEPVVIELLNVSKQDLRNDFQEQPHKENSKLWDRVYFKAYDLANGHPYTFPDRPDPHAADPRRDGPRGRHGGPGPLALRRDRALPRQAGRRPLRHGARGACGAALIIRLGQDARPSLFQRYPQAGSAIVRRVFLRSSRPVPWRP